MLSTAIVVLMGVVAVSIAISFGVSPMVATAGMAVVGVFWSLGRIEARVESLEHSIGERLAAIENTMFEIRFSDEVSKNTKGREPL